MKFFEWFKKNKQRVRLRVDKGYLKIIEEACNIKRKCEASVSI